jgi:flagellar basal-body rod protein FlgB
MFFGVRPKDMVMGDISFGPTIDMLKDAVKGSSETHTVIANNIANAETPNFKRSDVSFREALARELPRTDDPDELALVTDDPNQIPAGPDFEAEPFAITTTLDDSTAMRNDGSNVDIDQEMAKLSLNSSYGQTMHQLLSTQYSRLREAIQETTS